MVDRTRYMGSDALSAFCTLRILSNQANNGGTSWIKYSGKEVSWFQGHYGDESKKLKSFKASSGMANFQNYKFQGERDKGPVQRKILYKFKTTDD